MKVDHYVDHYVDHGPWLLIMVHIGPSWFIVTSHARAALGDELVPTDLPVLVESQAGASPERLRLTTGRPGLQWWAHRWLTIMEHHDSNGCLLIIDQPLEPLLINHNSSGS